MIRQLRISRRARALCALFSLVAMLASSSARADVISFDPDGAGGANGPSVTNTFDFAPGNTVLAHVGSLLVDKTGKFIEYGLQATLDNIQDGNGNPIAVAGLGSTFEITVALAFEGSADVAGAVTNFGYGGGASFFEVWYDNNALTKASNLAGTGFRDGTLILSGALTEASGAIVRHSSPTRFDQFPSPAAGDDNYGGLQTEQVVGGASMTALIGYADPNFFGQVPPILQLSFLNTSAIAPFSQVDPSQQFWGYIPNRGNVNGQGDDLQMQGDANATFQVPEPSTCALAVLGLIGLAFARRQRRG